VVHVQQRALRAFEQQVAAFGVHGVELARDIGNHGLEQLGMTHGFFVHGVELHFAVLHVGSQAGAEVEVLGTQHIHQNVVVQAQQLAQLGGEALGVLQVLHAQGAAGDLVFVGRADALAGGADLLHATLFTGRFTGHVQSLVERQDQRAGFGHAQALTHLHAGLFQAFDFFKQLAHGEHHTVADVALHAGAHDAAGNQVQSRLHAVDDQCVTGVVTALETHDAVGAFGQPVDQLALALVTPLGADDDHIATFGCIHIPIR
jgi:hypothetical protein